MIIMVPGITAYYNQDMYLNDLYALGDPFLSKLPAVREENWRIGHMWREAPVGYDETADRGLQLVRGTAFIDRFKKGFQIHRHSNTLKHFLPVYPKALKRQGAFFDILYQLSYAPGVDATGFEPATLRVSDDIGWFAVCTFTIASQKYSKTTAQSQAFSIIPQKEQQYTLL